jgi:predicted ribosome quality control (RQC) complex YloA/Tae2 family protein
MRTFSGPEIDEVISSLGICLGKTLNTAVVSEGDLVLGFWEGRRAIWLWLDLKPNLPALLPMVELPTTPQPKKSPMQLFLKAHFIGKSLARIERVEELGRVVRLLFADESFLEFRMIPRGVNVIVSSQGKQVSLKPVQELPTAIDVAPLGPARSLRELVDEWKATRFSSKPSSPKVNLEKKIDNLRRSLEKVKAEIDSKMNSPYRKLGDWLLQNQSLDVPEEFASLIDKRRKLAWNIEEAFRKAKESERKLEGTRARVVELKQEIVELEGRIAKGEWLQPEKKKVARKEQPSARTLRISESLQVVTGKSARDNMDLLRKAHAWDLWLHVKDQPSAHAILFRPKGAKTSDETLRKAAQWLLKTSLGSKYRNHVGEKFEILVTECRFVTAIKGDRLGRVNYRNEKVFITKFEG